MSKSTSNSPQNGTKKKTRNWGTIVYPESAPDGWLDTLKDLHVAAFVSPLHDSDINPGGEKKKPHYHVMLMFEGPKEEALARSLFEKIGGVGCEYINSARPYARYLCHLDNPDKAQYRIEDVQAFSGADYTGLIATPGDKYKVLREMITFVEENDIVAYSDLVTYAMDNREDWFQALADNCTYFIEKYIKSRSWKKEQARLRAALEANRS